MINSTPAPFRKQITLYHGTLSPADSTTYYFGAFPAVAAGTTDGNFRVYVTAPGRLTSAYGLWRNQSGVNGSNENSSFYVRVNSTTDYLISNTVQHTTATGTFSNTALSIDLAAGDYVEIKWVCPSWNTNPTNLLHTVALGFS